MHILALSLLALTASQGKDAVELDDVPPEVIATAVSHAAGLTFTEAERETRNGVVYFDLEGTDSTGAEWELDIMQTEDGWQVVEVQRDIDMADVPADVQASLKDNAADFAPVRIIESTQNDGQIVYEFFDADAGKREVLWDGETASFLEEEWEH